MSILLSLSKINTSNLKRGCSKDSYKDNESVLRLMIVIKVDTQNIIVDINGMNYRVYKLYLTALKIWFFFLSLQLEFFFLMNWTQAFQNLHSTIKTSK